MKASVKSISNIHKKSVKLNSVKEEISEDEDYHPKYLHREGDDDIDKKTD